MNLSSLKQLLLDRLPSAALSRAVGLLSDIELPGLLQRTINRAFVRFANIDISDAEFPAEHYKSINALFTRRLQPDARAIASRRRTLVSPVDGRLAEFGRIGDAGTLVQAKGISYGLSDLLHGDPDVERFDGGYYCTIYLAPHNYHRIHSPVDGEIVAMGYAPGRLLPVNRFGVRYVEDLFPRNERLTSFVESNDGHLVAVVKVGATCVGRISVAYDPFLTNATRIRSGFRRDFARPRNVERGDELGVFNLGSTVVLVIEGSFEFAPELSPGEPLRMGEALGSWVTDEPGESTESATRDDT